MAYEWTQLSLRHAHCITHIFILGKILFYGLSVLRLPDLKEFKRKRDLLVPLPDFQQINEDSIN